MKAAQRVIKWLAVAFAVFLIGVILSTLVGVGYIVGQVFDSFDDWDDEARTEIEIENSSVEEFSGEVRKLRFDVANTSVRVKRGDELKIERSDSRVKAKKDGATLVIEEDDAFGWDAMDNVEAVVYLPRDMEILEKVEIAMGAGKLWLEDLQTEELDLDLGAGRTEIQGAKVARKAEIDGGAGTIEVRESVIRNLDFDMGVGNADFSVRLEGQNKFSAGMGKLEVNLIGEENDYRVSVEQGLGGFEQEGISLDNPQGRNYVEIDGGVGSIVLRRSPEASHS